ncbi:hypothetical protein FQN57_005286 [Myotisia sp. PD_48]|nr:hypothetical protein FQN57_005286 [Myotisia sp. PD_48]
MKFANILYLAAQALIVVVTIPSGNAEHGEIRSPDLPDKFRIGNVTYGGTGCPSSTATATSTNPHDLTLVFNKYTASIGPDISSRENRKNCQLNIPFEFSEGYQFAIRATQTKGYAKLDKSVSGTSKTVFYFSGQSQQIEILYNFKGPLSEDYISSDETNTSRLWSPCGSVVLNINSQLRLTSTDKMANGTITNHSKDGNSQVTLNFVWQRCGTPNPKV